MIISSELKAKINDLYYMSNIYEINSFNRMADRMVKELQEEIGLKRKEAEKSKDKLRYFEIDFKKESIQTILELKIINEYRCLEVLLKSLFSKAYILTEKDSFSDWPSLCKTIKRRGVVLSEVNGYKEAYELKQVNNCLKHSNKLLNINNRTKHIYEFRKANKPDENSLTHFYQRVQPKVLVFVKCFTDKIVENLKQQVIR
tara:strand:- start:179877 stop:180479 length:603 start_codon:yes stop_codon:yes gene_type:complete